MIAKRIKWRWFERLLYKTGVFPGMLPNHYSVTGGAHGDGIAEAVKNAAVAGEVASLKQLVAAHGGAAVRLDGDPAELTALHWAAASGNVEAVRLPACPARRGRPCVPPGITTSPRCTRQPCRATRRCARC